MTRLAPVVTAVVAFAIAALGLAPPAGAQCPLPVCDVPDPTATPTPTPTPTPAPGDEPPAKPPPADPPPGAGEALAFGQDALRSGAATEENLFGPLRRLWSWRVPGSFNYPLLLDGKVIATVSGPQHEQPSSRVVAYAAGTGDQLWSRPTPGAYYVTALAAAAGRVFAADFAGHVTALRVSDGAPLWEADLPDGGSVQNGSLVAGDGYLFIAVNADGGGGRVWALSTADGRRLWSAEAPQTDGRPAYDGRRVYVTDGCQVFAYDRKDGRTAWKHDVEGGGCGGPGFPVVAGGRIYLGGLDGAILDAASGRRLPGSVPFARAGARDGRVVGFFELWGAFDAAGGASQWLLRRSDPLQNTVDRLGPVLTRAQTFVVAGDARLYGLDTASGKVQFSSSVRGAISPLGVVRGGMAAGQGILALTQGNKLFGYGPMLQPPDRGTDIAAGAFAVRYDRRVRLALGVGRALRDGIRRPMALEARPRNRGRWRVRARGRTMPDGSWQLRRRVDRNTAFRAVTPGAARSRRLTVYAFPGFSNRFVSVARRRVEVHQTVRGPRDMRATGRRVVLYLGRRKARRYQRLGAARLARAGRGRWVARVAFPPPRRVSGKDVLAVCVIGLARAGWGYPDAFQRGCGRRRMPYRP